MKQTLSRIVLSILWIVALRCPVTVQALDPSLLVPETELDSNVIQFYKVPFATRGSLWDPNIPVFDVKESISVGPYGLGQGQIGAIKEYCDPFDIVCADFGSVDVKYPMQVVIEYPHRRTLRELSEFTIKTRYYPQGTAELLSYFEPATPPFTASLKAPIKLLTGLTVQAALGVRLPDLCPLGDLFCRFGENKEILLFDLEQYFKTNFSGEQDLTGVIFS